MAKKNSVAINLANQADKADKVDKANQADKKAVAVVEEPITAEEVNLSGVAKKSRAALNNKKALCNCGSNIIYGLCCGKYIRGGLLPETAEQLMRSRYTAYTECNIDYIEATTKEAALADFDRNQALHLAKTSTWLGLKVIEHKPHPKDDNQAIVKFDAYFSINGKQGHIHETSKFKRIDQKWYYVDGR